MSRELGAPLRFFPAYMERVWGGDRLRALDADKQLPPGPIGEAWLIADHPQHESIVAEGPWVGASLHDMLQAEPEALLGRLPSMAHGNRFPLLLKLLDAAQVLSVQVHPNDAQAAQLGEADGGKTEMWHVLEADEGAALFCGFRRPMLSSDLSRMIKEGTIGEELRSVPAHRGLSMYVKAGTVHALGAGLMVAEIQQNSDVTYRIFDWGRIDASGQPRRLHIEEALFVANPDAIGLTLPRDWSYSQDGAIIHIEAFSRYFITERIELTGNCIRTLHGDSFSIMLSINGSTQIKNAFGTCRLKPYAATLLPACGGDWELHGAGSVLHYYVANVERDLIAPLSKAGFSSATIHATLADMLD